MALVTLTSTSNTNLSQTLSFKNNDPLCDASFSSNLNDADKSVVLKLAESSQNNLSLGRKEIEDGEIDIFGAEKYFNAPMDEGNPRVPGKGALSYINAPFPGTSSANSESSWNSQRMLLRSVQRNVSRRKTNKLQGKSFFASLGCNCACSDKDSIDIDEQACEDVSSRGLKCGGGKTRKGTVKTRLGRNELGLELKREDCGSSPNLNSKSEKLRVERRLQEDEDEEPGKSLEVFGSPILEMFKKNLGIERRFTTLSRDAMPRVEEIETSARSVAMYNDTESDTSSDLFEIESFRKNAKSVLDRQESDGMCDYLTPTACYAPSEGSIEWTVVTASVADFAMMSDYEELRTVTNSTNLSRIEADKTKEIEKRRPSLLSCKSHKAVRVAGDAYRASKEAIPETRRQHRSESFAAVTRIRAESKMTGTESRNGQHGIDA